MTEWDWSRRDPSKPVRLDERKLLDVAEAWQMDREMRRIRPDWYGKKPKWALMSRVLQRPPAVCRRWVKRAKAEGMLPEENLFQNERLVALAQLVGTSPVRLRWGLLNAVHVDLSPSD